ncbi:MAG: hypothetical protein R3A48_22315 [Polyangiales bacterium]
MSSRRHLPVLQSAPAAPAAPAQEPPAWHWIPLGSVVSLLALIPAAPAMLSGMRAALGLTYRPGSSAGEIAAARAAAPARSVAIELLAAAVPVATVLLCVALGAWVVGRRGARTNHRHGVLSGALTAALCGALAGSVTATLVLVPLAMWVGGAAARAGVARRERSAQDEPEDPGDGEQ